ncbi:MAG: hypothetical protein KDA55_23735 [Planctomycetales bacterium]|nr:hypothetical protein [Planctomycetales bacterium]
MDRENVDDVAIGYVDSSGMVRMDAGAEYPNHIEIETSSHADLDVLFAKVQGRIDYHQDKGLKYIGRYKWGVRIINILLPSASVIYVSSLIFGWNLDKVAGIVVIVLGGLRATFRPDETYLGYASALADIASLELRLMTLKLGDDEKRSEKIDGLLKIDAEISAIGKAMAPLPLPQAVSHWFAG